MTSNERNLDRLLERYADSCPETEAGANFMPAVWQRIDARRGFSVKLAYYARMLAMTAASLCLAAGLFEISAYGPSQQLASKHFVDVLDDDDDSEALIYGVVPPADARPAAPVGDFE